MVPQQIQKIQQEYTDKYVVVDETRPELARFKGHVGQVRTVNMAGRALVEFVDYHANTGRYDIDIDFLKVVDKPAPREDAKKKTPAKAPPAVTESAVAVTEKGGKKLSPLELARMQGAAEKGRAKKPEKKSVAAKAGGTRSVSDILAAARAEKQQAGDPEASPEGATAPPVGPSPSDTEGASGQDGASDIHASTEGAPLDRSSMTTQQILAWCRGHDA